MCSCKTSAGEYITEWDIRGFSSNVEGAATLGARCSDGSLLTPVPALAANNSQIYTDVYVIGPTAGYTSLDAGCCPLLC